MVDEKGITDWKILYATRARDTGEQKQTFVSLEKKSRHKAFYAS